MAQKKTDQFCLPPLATPGALQREKRRLEQLETNLNRAAYTLVRQYGAAAALARYGLQVGQKILAADLSGQPMEITCTEFRLEEFNEYPYEQSDPYDPTLEALLIYGVTVSGQTILVRLPVDEAPHLSPETFCRLFQKEAGEAATAGELATVARLIETEVYPQRAQVRTARARIRTAIRAYLRRTRVCEHGQPTPGHPAYKSGCRQCARREPGGILAIGKELANTSASQPGNCDPVGLGENRLGQK